MPPNTIRPIAICVFRDDGRILVAEAFDSHKNAVFYRPLGGTIEFGEHSAETIRREIREEIGAEVKDLYYLGTLENIFVYEGQTGHEIVQVYDGRLADKSLYERDIIEGYESDIHERFKVVWKRLDEFTSGNPPVYPDGLLYLMRAHDE